MDQELIAYFDAKFAEVNHHFDQRFDGVDQRFDGVDKRLDGVDKRLDGVDKRLDGVDKRLDGVDKRLDKAEQQNRETAVVVEQLASDVKAVAEGHTLLSDKLDAIYQEIKQERRSDRGEMRSAVARLGKRDDELEERIERLEATG